MGSPLSGRPYRLDAGEAAAPHAQAEWIGIAGKNPDRARFVKKKVEADFVTQDYRELLRRSEVTAIVVATDEHLHADPSCWRRNRNKPSSSKSPSPELSDSARVLSTIQQSGVDAVVGYTQRFRRRWLAAKEKVRTAELGDVTLVTSRAFMNRLLAIDNYRRTSDPDRISSW